MIAVISVASLAGLAFLSLIVFLGVLAFVVAPGTCVLILEGFLSTLELQARLMNLVNCDV